MNISANYVKFAQADLVSVTASSVWCKTAKPSVSTVTIFDNSIDGGALWKAKLRASAACIHIRASQCICL